MNERRATIAIVRRHIDRRFGVDWLMAFALVAALAAIFTPSFGYAALFVLAALASVMPIEGQHIASLKRLTFFSVPLFGRQLARAHAVAPTLAALALPCGYAAGAAIRGVPIAPERFVVAIGVVAIATLVALSATFREGRDRALYVGLALTASVSLAAVDRVAGPTALPIVVALALLVGYVALRAFGETLARYDPLPTIRVNVT